MIRVSGCSRLPVPPARMTPVPSRISVLEMAGVPEDPAGTRPRFSPDGLWWWDGAQWRSALSPDGLWRWDGRSWVPARPVTQRGAGGSGRSTLLVTCLVLGGILLLVGLITMVVLYTMGNQIGNVFDNVVTALNGG